MAYPRVRSRETMQEGVGESETEGFSFFCSLSRREADPSFSKGVCRERGKFLVKSLRSAWNPGRAEF